MNKALLIIAILCSSMLVKSQTYFQKYISNGGGGRSIIKTSDGGYAIAGTANVAVPNAEAYLAKFDSTGNLQWTQTFNNTGFEMAQCVVQTFDGGYALTGRSGYWEFKVLVMKLNASGNIQWAKTFNNGNFDQGYSIIQTVDSGFAVGARTFTFNGYSAYIIKLNNSGGLQWTATPYGFEDGAYSILQTPDLGYAISGFTQGSAGATDLFIAKLNTTGSVQWSKAVGGAGNELCNPASRLIRTTDGGFAMTGFTNSFGAGGNDVYVIKLGSTGNLLWTRVIGGTGEEYGYGIVQSSDKGYVVTGSTTSFGAGNEDAYFVRLDSNGVVQWTRTAGGTAADAGNSIVQANDGGYIATGSTASYGNGGSVYLVKLTSSGTTCGTTFTGGSSLTGGSAGTGSGTIGSVFADTVTVITPGTGSLGTLTTICSCLPSASITPLGPTTFCSGGSVTLSANTGAGITYQWYKNLVAIAGATSSTYSVNTSGSYYVRETGACGSVNSNSINVTVNSLPTATISPGGNVNFCTGPGITLLANTGAGLTYQWRKNSVNISGATNSSYLANSTGTFNVIVSNNSGCSKGATPVNVTSPPSVTITSSGATHFCTGGSVTLTATSGQTVTYKWKKNGAYIAGATNSSYVATSTGSYNCIVTNSFGCSKGGTPIAVTGPPSSVITANGPTTFCAGDNVQLSAASGYTYQWIKNSGNINGATQQNYTATTAGNYKVKVTDPFGCSKTTPNSNQITVNVPCREGHFLNSTESDLIIYPNPSTGIFEMMITSGQNKNTEIKIYSPDGRLIKKQTAETNNPFTVDLTQQADGIYFIHVIADGQLFIQKLIKQ